MSALVSSLPAPYMIVIIHIFSYYSPEPHILLFRRPLGTDPQSGRVDPELKRQALKEYEGQFGLLRK